MLEPSQKSYKMMDDTAGRGVGILMTSSEMHELIGMSDRIYIMREGMTVRVVSAKANMDQERLIAQTIGADVS